jgi:cysteine desulfurase/selenocysteine lyase
MEPYQGGGEMIREVKMDGATWADIPHRFEAGTPNIAGVVGFGPALDYVERLGYEAIARHGEDLVGYALQRLHGLGGLRILGPSDPHERSGAIAFSDPIVHPHDLSTVLDQEGVAIRAGHHCAQPLHRRYGLVATARASFYIYNDRDDVDALVAAIESARKYFG